MLKTIAMLVLAGVSHGAMAQDTAQIEVRGSMVFARQTPETMSVSCSDGAYAFVGQSGPEQLSIHRTLFPRAFERGPSGETGVVTVRRGIDDPETRRVSPRPAFETRGEQNRPVEDALLYLTLRGCAYPGGFSLLEVSADVSGQVEHYDISHRFSVIEGFDNQEFWARYFYRSTSDWRGREIGTQESSGDGLLRVEVGDSGFGAAFLAGEGHLFIPFTLVFDITLDTLDLSRL